MGAPVTVAPLAGEIHRCPRSATPIFLPLPVEMEEARRSALKTVQRMTDL